MGTRVLTWYELCRVADRRNPPDRIIALAGLPAVVVPSPRRGDPGFYVRTVEEDLGPTEKWSLRTVQEIVLLRQLVDAGQVTIDDGEDPWRLDEWHRRLAADPECFVYGCESADIDRRGPVFDRQERMHLACPAHWEGVYRVLGEQQARNPEIVEVKVFGQDEPVRRCCVICGAGADTPHDTVTHMNAAGPTLARADRED